jgi:23S rRNA pseudouridine2605 synthase
MRPPKKTGGPGDGDRRPTGNSRPPYSDRSRPTGDQPFRARESDAGAPRPVRPRPPRAQDESLTTSRREAERFETPTADRRRHIPGGRLPKLPASAPRDLKAPPRAGRPSRNPDPAPFSDLPAANAHGRRDTVAAARKSEDAARRAEKTAKRAERDAPRRDEPRAAPTGRRGRGEARVAAREATRAGNTAVPVEPQRIAKLLARAGIGSRRDIERMITEGKVALKGSVLTTPAMVIDSLDGITVEGQPVAALEPSRLFRFHKPAGFLTTARDPGGRPTIMDILPPGLPRVVPVGRLDMNTEGLLLLTTDGALKRALELPMSGVPRRYRVRAYGEISQPQVENLIEGVTIDGMRYGPIDAEIERRTGRNLWLTITLTEGKNREIRRVLEHLGLQVSRLIRVGYGPIELGDLPPRDADEVPDGVVASLRKSLTRS